jgi:cellobiose phosphorylase
MTSEMTLENPSGLTVELLLSGAVKSIQVDPIRISLKAATPYGKPGTDLYLRKRGKSREFAPLLGPESHSRFQIAEGAFIAVGTWAGLDYRCVLRLSGQSPSWQWQVEIMNRSNQPVKLDLVYVQDAGLKPLKAGLPNEYYVAQYLERRLLSDQTFGAVACCRQNMRESTGHPWFLLACQNGAHSGTTDGMRFYGRSYRESGVPEGLLSDHLDGEYAGESPVFALQESPFKLAAGQVHRSAFVGAYEPNHAGATSEEDLRRLPALIREFDDATPRCDDGAWVSPSVNLFNSSPLLPVEDLDETELNHFFGSHRRHAESEDGRLLSFFSADDHHVVLRAKEARTDRPHAHIMQAQAGSVPD